MNCALYGKSMKLGTHIYDTNSSKLSYSAIPDSLLWGCGKVFKMADSKLVKIELVCFHGHLSVSA